MEALYMKLYEKYSKLKASKDAKSDETNKEQEDKFMEFLSASESLIEHLRAENKRLCQDVDGLRSEVRSVRAAKDQELFKLQRRLMEEKQKNQQLSEEVEHLRNMQQEGIVHSNMRDRHEVQHVNNVESSPCVSGDQANESPRRNTRKRGSDSSPRVSGDRFQESPTRMTRRRAKLLAANDSAVNGSGVSPHSMLSNDRGLSAGHSKGGSSKVGAPQPACCRTDLDSEGGSCMFQSLVECLIGMKVSIIDPSEGRCVRVTHQTSGYSFSLTWMNKASPHEGEWLYNVSSLGTFSQVAPEWMREVIMFSMSMCPIFFERVSRIIKQA